MTILIFMANFLYPVEIKEGANRRVVKDGELEILIDSEGEGIVERINRGEKLIEAGVEGGMIGIGGTIEIEGMVGIVVKETITDKYKNL